MRGQQQFAPVRQSLPLSCRTLFSVPPSGIVRPVSHRVERQRTVISLSVNCSSFAEPSPPPATTFKIRSLDSGPLRRGKDDGQDGTQYARTCSPGGKAVTLHTRNACVALGAASVPEASFRRCVDRLLFLEQCRRLLHTAGVGRGRSRIDHRTMQAERAATTPKMIAVTTVAASGQSASSERSSVGNETIGDARAPKGCPSNGRYPPELRHFCVSTSNSASSLDPNSFVRLARLTATAWPGYPPDRSTLGFCSLPLPSIDGF